MPLKTVIVSGENAKSTIARLSMVIGVGVGDGVSVSVGVDVGVNVGVRVSVGLNVGVGVGVSVGVLVGVGVKVGVNVGVGVRVGVSVGVSVGVKVKVGVNVGVGVFVGVDVGDNVGVAVGVKVGIGVGEPNGFWNGRRGLITGKGFRGGMIGKGSNLIKSGMLGKVKLKASTGFTWEKNVIKPINPPSSKYPILDLIFIENIANLFVSQPTKIPA